MDEDTAAALYLTANLSWLDLAPCVASADRNAESSSVELGVPPSVVVHHLSLLLASLN